MAINNNQLSVAKIYPGNYINVLRYWHEEKTITAQNANGVDTSFTGQPIGGPVGVIFRPGQIAQQAIGYVDLSYQVSSDNQLAYYAQPYGSGQNGANQPFLNASVIIPSPDANKDVRADITDGISVPSGVYIYRMSIRVDGGDVVSSGVAGAVTAPTLGLGPAVAQGLNETPTVSGHFVVLSGANSRITNGSWRSNDVWNSSTLRQLRDTTQFKLFTVSSLGGAAASGYAQGSGIYDPRAQANKLAGKDKALAICEICWLLPDEAPKRADLALQPGGIIESNAYTSTTPS